MKPQKKNKTVKSNVSKKPPKATKTLRDIVDDQPVKIKIHLRDLNGKRSLLGVFGQNMIPPGYDAETYAHKILAPKFGSGIYIFTLIDAKCREYAGGEVKVNLPPPIDPNFVIIFAKLCRDKSKAIEIKEFLKAAQKSGYSLGSLIDAFEEVFKSGLCPIAGQPGLFKNLETNEIANIRDF